MVAPVGTSCPSSLAPEARMPRHRSCQGRSYRLSSLRKTDARLDNSISSHQCFDRQSRARPYDRQSATRSRCNHSLESNLSTLSRYHRRRSSHRWHIDMSRSIPRYKLVLAVALGDSSLAVKG